MTRQLQAYVVSGRTGDEQNRWLLWTAIGGVILGITLWAAFGGALARATPDSWPWPESMAARTLGLPMWEAGQRMLRAADPAAFGALVASDRIVRANCEAIERCGKVAARARDSVRCTIRVAPAP